MCGLVVQEHKCVLDSCRSLEMDGFHVTYLPVQPNGIIDLKVSAHTVMRLFQFYHTMPLVNARCVVVILSVCLSQP